jgi:protein-arginine kinase activator protein McsA
MSVFLKRLYQFPCQKEGCKRNAAVELVREVADSEEETMGYYCESCGKKANRKYHDMQKLGVAINNTL